MLSALIRNEFTTNALYNLCQNKNIVLQNIILFILYVKRKVLVLSLIIANNFLFFIYFFKKYSKMSKWRFVILNVPRGRGLQKKNIRKNYQGEKLYKSLQKENLAFTHRLFYKL